MDKKLEFSAQAFCKMFMHTMKYSHAVCCGLLLSPKPSDDEGSDKGGENDRGNQGDTRERNSEPTTKIIDVIPLLHTSHYLAPTMEIALNSVNVYAQEQELIISGYYQACKYDAVGNPDIFGQRVTEKIAETYPDAVLCLIGYEISASIGGDESPEYEFCVDQHHFVDGKWRRKPSQAYEVDEDINIIKKTIIYSRERLYRQIVDFDDHFDNISLDWTNAKISQRIDHLVANIC